MLGIDEHFFTRRSGYATTLCDLRNHKIYDVVLGDSEDHPFRLCGEEVCCYADSCYETDQADKKPE